MSVLMKGADVANAMKEELIEKTNHLKEQGVTPVSYTHLTLPTICSV